MRKLAIIVAAAIVCMGETFAGSTIYVLPSAEVGGDGRSWQSAFRSVHAALFVANGGDEIWVAKGTYVVGAEGLNLSKEVSMYGGFSGVETQRSQRDWRTNRTIIQAKSNASPVVTVTGVSSNTTIDGFVVQGAPHRAFHIDQSSIVISNTVFRNNTAVDGGAITIINDSRPTFRYCEFSNNTAQYSGGAVLIEGSELHPNTGATFESCFFVENVAGLNGGALAIRNSSAETNFWSCVVFGCKASEAAVMSIDAARVNIAHTTMVRNSALALSPQAYGISVRGGSTLLLSNSILWTGDGSTSIQLFVESGLNSKNTVLATANLIERDFFRGQWQHTPEFVDVSRPSGFDRVYGTDDDGLRLAANSTLLNVAVLTGGDASRTSDVRGKPRSVFSAADIGAYERQRESYWSVTDLRNHLRSGSAVVLVRPPHSEPRTSNEPIGCTDSIALSETGRRIAETIGSHLRVLIPTITESISGTACTDWETAQIIAGFADKESAWDSTESNPAARMRDVQKGVSGGRIICASEPVLRRITGVPKNEIREGDALIINRTVEPFKVVGHITSDGWQPMLLADVPANVHDAHSSNGFIVSVEQSQLLLTSSSDVVASVTNILGETIWRATVFAGATRSVSLPTSGLYFVSTPQHVQSVVLIH